ncbi:hypothetical protein LSTR_LSTR002571 [Laodelphax striatellus]|uniref:Rab-GAP TBC domain-containing protein n=1 Tax=Laodelphax striatellus TaxID=195883 RepID=A0A482XMZ4_LAOST|nr:hypothetical protein LSTR_LSTR002571 [Laodelphax striatellus]
MPLSRIIKKASNFILRSQYESTSTPAYTDGEIVFCKNNVCVHPPTMVRQETDIVHHPGYLTVTCQTTGDKCTLLLSWIPNTTLRKHPGTVEQRSSSVTRTGKDSEEKVGTRRRSTSAARTPSGVHIGRRYSSGSYETECVGCFPENKLSSELKDIYISKGSISSCSDNNSLTPSEELRFDAIKNKPIESSLNNEGDIEANDGKLNKHDSNHNDEAYQKQLESKVDPRSSDIIIEEPLVQNENNSTVPKINQSSSNTSSLVSDSSSSCQMKTDENVAKDSPSENESSINCDETVPSITGTSKPTPPSVYTFQRPEGILYVDSLVLQEYPHILNLKSTCANSAPNRRLEESCVQSLNDRVREAERRLSVQSNEDGPSPLWMSSPELLALKHNLTFPESVTASPVVRRAQKCCRKFCVDLSEMRSLRLFFCDAESTKGQLVVASRECQYKILHFHHGGLERLATVLQQWNLLSPTTPSDNLPYRHFMVCRPAMDDSELHPEEGKVGMVTEAEWNEMLNPLGQVEDDLVLRKGIFLGGLEPSLRKTVWPFLLYCYSYQSTAVEREHITAIRRKEYELITKKRLSLEGAAKERFIRNIQCVVEKDVIRTDRGNPYYAGDSNPHVETMKNILLNYAIYDSGSGYMQGMSDLLAPVLAEIGHEADAFWCFVGLMSRAIFVCTPTDSDMERNLTYLRELIREMVPEFYSHLQRHTDAMELLFCHRWILLCFKREFPEEVALKMWEACWANYLTDYFNLFLCLAIVSAYADDVIAQDLRTDEMLLHFSSLALYMDGDLILRKARGLLYQFRQRTVIPCSLAELCQECGPGMWDSGHAPSVICRGENCPQTPCPYRGISTSEE